MSKASRRKARGKQKQRMAARAPDGTPPARAAAPAPGRTAIAPKRPAPEAVEAGEPGSADALHALLAPTGVLNVLAIARRDLAAMFVSPVGWVVAALFTFLVSGFGFIAPVLAGQQATMDGVFGVITNFLMVVLIPVVTMRVLAEERSRGTLELLLTSPVRDWEVTVAKWLGAFFFYVLLLATTLVYVAILRFYVANLDLGLIAATYLGLLLVGGAAVAIGVLASSLTRNQIVAFFIAMVALLVTWYAGYLIGYFVAPPANLFFEYAGGFNRFQSFLLGQATLRDIVYFLSLIVGSLFLTTRVLASRRWR
jgi:ABC-2 type transport system permease protein